MLSSNQIRKQFLDFFASKGHTIVESAPMVVKNDPTLLFINSGMAPFKDIFLGNAPIKHPRIADTQKCLRVSGKHNDLEEVGVDTYHHTMFEMLGNWSFGDYFKKDAIAWAWELLTEVYKIDKNRLYVTIFEGDAKENLERDTEAYETWKKYIAEDRILNGNKKDNFWEMGDQGPCGPCSEIHYDGRSDEERKLVDGSTLVNNDHPNVIEVWNNVFMEFNRKADGSLEKLPKQHVDTGMGFERLVRVLQGKSSNYDTDVFMPLIEKIEGISKHKYGSISSNEIINALQLKVDIAMRVIADHIRTVAFSITDGQLPSNNKAGYVIRRILRRAIRYGYSNLGIKHPFMYMLVETLCSEMGVFFKELNTQKKLIEKVIREEEEAFLRTLGNGLNLLNSEFKSDIENNSEKTGTLSGEIAFTLSDTFGFPIDLTQLICRENNYEVDMVIYNKCLDEQKTRSRAAAVVDTDDWVVLIPDAETNFVGYTQRVSKAKITRYRKVATKAKSLFQLVLNTTPFYAESGGQVGDKGFLDFGTEKIEVLDTKKENGVTMHICEILPTDLNKEFEARVDVEKRNNTENNHSATHLMHAALRTVLGTHVEQKGSLVNDEYLRFDFSHFSKVTDEEIAQIEKIVNQKIRENIQSNIQSMSIDDAKKTGAMALFGEKYGDVVRVVTFNKDYSIELCGGTHVAATGNIGYFKIISESAVAAGIRRIEAITGAASEKYIESQFNLIDEVKQSLKNPKDVLKSIVALQDQNTDLQKQVDVFLREKAKVIKQELKQKIVLHNGVSFVAQKIELDSAEAIKDIAFQLKAEIDNFYGVIAAEIKGKPSLSVVVSDNLVNDKKMNASTIVRELAKEINGGGGGQAFYATAGGTKAEGVESALKKAIDFIV